MPVLEPCELAVYDEFCIHPYRKAGLLKREDLRGLLFCMEWIGRILRKPTHTNDRGTQHTFLLVPILRRPDNEAVGHVVTLWARIDQRSRQGKIESSQKRCHHGEKKLLLQLEKVRFKIAVLICMPLDVEVERARPVWKFILRLPQQSEKILHDLVEVIPTPHDVIDRHRIVEIHENTRSFRLVVFRDKRWLFHSRLV